MAESGVVVGCVVCVCVGGGGGGGVCVCVGGGVVTQKIFRRGVPLEL